MALSVTGQVVTITKELVTGMKGVLCNQLQRCCWWDRWWWWRCCCCCSCNGFGGGAAAAAVGNGGGGSGAATGNDRNDGDVNKGAVCGQ